MPLHTKLRMLEAELITQKMNQQRTIAETIISAQEQERNSLGHELHDNVNQLLTTTKLYLEMLNPSSGNEFMVVNKAKELIMKAISEIRNLSKNAVAPKFEEKSLVESIQELLEDINIVGRYYISFVHEDEKSVEMSGSVKMAIYRIVQEQLKNIIKHSKAKTIRVKLAFADKNILLAIKDDGVGFDTATKSRGIGLSNIFDRASLYKGTMSLTSAPGVGCSLEIVIPEDQH